MTLIPQSVITELTDLAKAEGVVVWMPEEWWNEEEYERAFPELKIIFADKGFLNLNMGLANRGEAPSLVLAKDSSKDESILQTVLRARFVTFNTSFQSQLRKELGWQQSLEPWLLEHGALFDEPRVADKLRKLRVADLDPSSLSEKAVYAAVGADARINFAMAMHILSAEAEDVENLLRTLAKANLEEKFWQIVARELGYKSKNPAVTDFRYWLANSLANLAASPIDQMPTASSDLANLAFFFEDFRIRHESAYMRFCEEHSDLIAAQVNFSALAVEELAAIPNLPNVDRQILDKLLDQVSGEANSITSKYAALLIEQRSKSPWFRDLRPLFESLKHGLEVLELVAALDLFAGDFQMGIERYASSWYRVDFAYRKHVLVSRTQRGLNSEFANFSNLVEQAYVNGFQNKLGDQWASVVEKMDSWPSSDPRSNLRGFYKSRVLVPLSNEKNKVAVVISDALRYEIGAELRDLLTSEGFMADLEHLIAPLPSYTQLGMAALLPNDSITLKPEDKTVLVDDRPSAGLANRKKILELVGGSALDYEPLVKESNLRERLSSSRLWYIYHNKVDKVGDNAASEGGVFEAAEDALKELRDVVRRLSKAGFQKIFVTADHGFLYQDSEIPAHGFLSTVPEGEVTEFMNRRFIIGRGLQAAQGLKSFTSSQLGYEGDYEVQIPLSTLRLRRQGSGLRFVHGGGTLQEVVVPVLSVSKRKSELSQVQVSLATGSTRKITTGVLSLRLAQDSPVSSELAPRRLRAFVAQGDDILSTTQEAIFESSDPESRNRISTLNLVMANRANSLASRHVQVKLESNITNTEQWIPYAQFDFEIANLAERDF